MASSGIRFHRDYPEEACRRVVHDPNVAEECACLRVAGHPGECIGMRRDAAAADGRCGTCNALLIDPHRPRCDPQ